MKELTKQENALANQQLDEWGQPEFDHNDLVIEKIIIGQPTSKAVATQEALAGDIYTSNSYKILGNIGSPKRQAKPVAFIPFLLKKNWMVQKQTVENGHQKLVYAGMEPVTSANVNRKREEIVNGIPHIYTYCMDFYVVLAEDLEKDDDLIPYVISFKNTALRTGKILSTQMYMTNRRERLAPAGRIIHLDGEIKTNDKGTFAIPSIRVGNLTSKDGVAKCLELFKLMNQQEVKVHDEEVPPVPPTKPVATQNFDEPPHPAESEMMF